MPAQRSKSSHNNLKHNHFKHNNPKRKNRNPRNYSSRRSRRSRRSSNFGGLTPIVFSPSRPNQCLLFADPQKQKAV